MVVKWLSETAYYLQGNKKNHYSGKSSNILTAVLIFKINITSERQMAIRYPQI